MAKDSNKPKDSSKPKPPPTNTTSTQRTAARAAERRKEREKERSVSGTGGRTVERRKEREKERQRQRLITGGVIAVALIAVVVIIFLIVNAPAGAPIPAAALTRYEGLQQTTTTEGFPRLGNTDASVQFAEYSSFGCPHCRDFHNDAADQIVARVKTGKMAFTYVPLYGYGDVANDQGAAAAAVCAGEQGQFWPFHDALFDWQGEFGNQAFTNNRINGGVAAFKLDQGKYTSCISSGRAGAVLDAAKRQAAALLNFQNSTPTFTINGVVPLDDNQQPISDTNGILAKLDGEIARVKPEPTAESTAATGATAEATEGENGVSTEVVPVGETVPVTEAATAPVTPETTPAS